MRWQAPNYNQQQQLENLDWHTWIAWYPVRINMTWVWLEPVWRKVTYAIGYRFCRYRFTDPR